MTPTPEALKWEMMEKFSEEVIPKFASVCARPNCYWCGVKRKAVTDFLSASIDKAYAAGRNKWREERAFEVAQVKKEAFSAGREKGIEEGCGGCEHGPSI